MKKMIVLALMMISCDSYYEEINETDIMNTVCIDGVRNLSVFDGYKCYYHPLTIRGIKVRCE